MALGLRTPITETLGHRKLLYGLGAYVTGYALHTLAHVAMGLRRTPTLVIAGGSTAWLLTLVLITMVIRHHWLAAHAAALLGFLVCAGLLAVHIPPHWSPLSEPLRADAGWGMWTSLAASTAGSCAMTVAGLSVLATRHS